MRFIESKKKKILYLIYSLNAGGIESLCINILKNIDLNRFTIDFLVIKDKDKEQFYDHIVQAYGMKIYSVGDLDSGIFSKYITSRKGIYNVIKNGNYDIVHIHCGHCDKFPDAIIAKICGVKKIIIHSHNGQLTNDTKLYKMRYLLQLIIKQFYPFIATDFFTCSDLATKWAFPNRIIKKNKVVQINNGIDTDFFTFSEQLRKKVRSELQLEEKFVIGHIGRFAKQKNHEFLIDIFYHILERESSACLLLIGTGELEEKIKKKVESLGLVNKVIFYGTTSDIPGMLAAMDVFVFPSLFEGLPVSGIEVQAMALKTVASLNISDDVRISEYWSSMDIKDSPENWANKILQYLGGYERRNMKDHIYNAGFDIKGTVDRLSKIYEEEECRYVQS